MSHEDTADDPSQGESATDSASVVDEQLEEQLDEQLQTEFGLDREELADLDELLTEYADALREVHEEYRDRLRENGFAEFVGVDEETDIPAPDYPIENDAGPRPSDDAIGGLDGDVPAERIRRLDELREEGIISESEFEDKKSSMLGQL